jgi:16S rRNA (guanine1516-N2)-methyltransferase
MPSPVRVDFNSGKAAYRRGQTELLAKAIGVYKYKKPLVIDATAGLGQDAFVLATLGCKITLIERHPLIHLILADGIQRALNSPETAEPASRLTLIHADASTWLSQISSAGVIYIDPMFPPRRKSAMVKKEMQLLQALLEGNPAEEPLLPSALQKACYRTVVKRSLKGRPLEGVTPDFAVSGRSTRFDVYLARPSTNQGS